MRLIAFFASSLLTGSLILLSGCSGPQSSYPVVNIPKGFSKPVPLFADTKPMTGLNATVDFNGGQHVAFELRGKVHLLHSDPPLEDGETKSERMTYQQEFEGSQPQVVFVGENLYLGVIQNGELNIYVLGFPPYDAPKDKKGDYPTLAVHKLGKAKSYGLGVGAAESVISAAFTNGKGVKLMKVTQAGAQEVAELAKGKTVQSAVSSMDAKGRYHTVWNEGSGESINSFYASFKDDFSQLEKPMVIADHVVPSFFFSLSSQVHFSGVRDAEKLPAFYLLNDWMETEIKGISPGLDEMSVERKLAYEGAGNACNARVRMEQSNFYGQLMWMDGCSTETPSLGYAKVDLKEEKFIFTKHHLFNGVGLDYDFTFDAENYLNLFVSVADKDQYILYLTTYSNQDELPKKK